MSPPRTASHPSPLKIAVVGTPGVGRAALVQRMVERYGGPAVAITALSGAYAVQGSLEWTESVAIPVHLHAFYGDPDFSCLQRMLMEGCHGYVFVAAAHPERIPQAPVVLRRFLHDAEALGVNFATMPVALQYHGIEHFPGFNPEDMDRFLKISPAQIPRFATSSEGGDECLAAIEGVIRTILSRFAQPRLEAAG